MLEHNTGPSALRRAPAILLPEFPYGVTTLVHFS